jgi:hypothetical protein
MWVALTDTVVSSSIPRKLFELDAFDMLYLTFLECLCVLQVESIMRQKLKNPNIFVSTTRLCVRNIPTSVDDRALKKVFLKAADNPQAKITEVWLIQGSLCKAKT